MRHRDLEEAAILKLIAHLSFKCLKRGFKHFIRYDSRIIRFFWDAFQGALLMLTDTFIQCSDKIASGAVRRRLLHNP
jgi:hypothetical protein